MARRIASVKLEDAKAIVDFVVREAPSPVSVFIADTHGELVAAATMDGAAPDTRLNAQRKAYTAWPWPREFEMNKSVRPSPLKSAAATPIPAFGSATPATAARSSKRKPSPAGSAFLPPGQATFWYSRFGSPSLAT